MRKPRVVILIGSKTDEPKVKSAKAILDTLRIPWVASIISAHRHARTNTLDSYIKETILGGENLDSDIGYVLAAAGMAADLPAAVASKLVGTNVVVVGVALSSPEFPNALDALLNIVRMPPGIPLVCSGIDEAGAVNGTLFIAESIANQDHNTRLALNAYYDESGKKKPAQINYEVGSAVA